MKRRYAPSPTLLLHIAVVFLGATFTMGFTTKVRLAPAPAAVRAHDIQLRTPVSFRLGLGPGRVLPAGSRWRPAGSLAQGTVYRPLNGVVLVEGRPVDEAWPVVDAGKLQGFFLPSEARFAPLPRTVPLALGESKA